MLAAPKVKVVMVMAVTALVIVVVMVGGEVCEVICEMVCAWSAGQPRRRLAGKESRR